MGFVPDASFPSVRRAIDLSLDTTTLPDDVLSDIVYQATAEAEVARRDPLYLTRTGTAATHIANAAVLYLAAAVVPALPAFTSESFDGRYSYNRQRMTADAMVAALVARADAEIVQVVEVTTSPLTAERPTMFAVASGTRGR